MGEISPSAKKVADAAAALGLSIHVREMDRSTRTAEEAADACGVSVGQIVKSLVFVRRQSKQPLLLLVSGKNRVNEKGIALHLGEPLERPAAERVRDLTGYAIGGIPPFGHAARLPTFIDRDLLDYELVWAAAGTPRAVFSIDPRALAAVTGAKPIDVS